MKKHLSTGLLFLTAALAASAQNAPTIEERLQALEAKLEAVSKENAELRTKLGAETKKLSPVSFTPAGKENKLTVGGLIHAQSEFGGKDDPRYAGINDRMYFRRARIIVSGTFAENFEFKIEGDFGANSITPASGLRAMANEIYVGWTKYSAANIRFGYIKPAFGAEQLAGDPTLPFIERSIANDRIVDGRQTGVSVAGNFLEKKLSYLVVLGNGTGINSSINDNNKFHRSARISGIPFSGKLGELASKVQLGASAMQSEDVGLSKSGYGFTGNSFTGKREGWAIDGAASVGPVSLEAEYLQATFKPTSKVPAQEFSAEGWKLNLLYMAIPNTLQLVAQRSTFDPNTDVTTNNNVEMWVVGANWFIKGDDIKASFNYLFRDSGSSVNDSGRLIARLQLLF